MVFNAEIPYGAYWSTPFARWQGSFADLHALEFAANTAALELGRRGIPGEALEHGVLGFSVPQKHSFYGLPWVAGRAGLPHLAGPTIMQACATGVRTLLAAVQEIEVKQAHTSLVITCDRTSNGPHLYYPNPKGAGGTGGHEDWVLNNFGNDPSGGHSMLQTAENVATKHQIATGEQHDVVLMRENQYRSALANGGAFQKRYISLPFEVPHPSFRKIAKSLAGDEGIRFSTSEGLAKLEPVLPDGTVTYGGQTHPADGNAGIIVTASDRVSDFSCDPNIRVRIHGFGSARAALAFMPEAPIPAAQRALAAAGTAIDRMDAVKTHNPFALNDILFSRQTGFPLEKMNNYGCSLVWGHPQAPMATRAIIELIEELTERGGDTDYSPGVRPGTPEWPS